MGRLLFAHHVRLDVDDRSLAHLQVAMLAKLRRGESFHLSWSDDASIGDGRTTLWIHPDTSLVFKSTGPAEPLNPEWVEELMIAANSVPGLTLVPEPGVPERAEA